MTLLAGRKKWLLPVSVVAISGLSFLSFVFTYSFEIDHSCFTFRECPSIGYRINLLRSWVVTGTVFAVLTASTIWAARHRSARRWVIAALVVMALVGGTLWTISYANRDQGFGGRVLEEQR